MGQWEASSGRYSFGLIDFGLVSTWRFGVNKVPRQWTLQLGSVVRGAALALLGMADSGLLRPGGSLQA